jgi:hypothetical protein
MLEAVMAMVRGCLLGAANVLVIALAMAIKLDDRAVASFVILLGGLPGVGTGAVLGWFAHLIGARPPALRVVLLAIPAMLVVIVLAAAFGMDDLALVSCIPTLVAVLLLERGTRRVAPAPVPVATARSA